MTDELFRFMAEERDRLSDVTSAGDILDRQYGPELTSWERSLVRGFEERLSGRLYRHRGFVHHTRNSSMFVLTPSPWLVDGVFVHVPEGTTIPPDGSFVEIIGSRAAVRRSARQSAEPVPVFVAESIELLPMDFLNDVQPPLDLDEISSLLFERVGLPEASKRVFSLLFASSPPFEGAVGGLSTGIEVLTSQRRVQRLLTFLRRVLPSSLRSSPARYTRVRGVPVLVPRLWRLDAGQLSPSRLRAICVHRHDPSGFREVSVGALTDATTSALPDVPLALTSEDFWVDTRDATDLRLPLIKSIITFQMLTPSVSRRSVDAATSHILERLQRLRDSMGLSDSVLARGNILDADALGRPLSALRLARAVARSGWSTQVRAREIRRAWDRILEPALREFIEIHILRSEGQTEWGTTRVYEQLDSRVLRALKRLDPGTGGSLGPTTEEIAQEAGVEISVTSQALEKMKNAGVVYEPRPGHYRPV